MTDLTLGSDPFGTHQASFVEHLRSTAPHLLPQAAGMSRSDGVEIPHGTTIVAVSYPGGVLLAGDRRATTGNVIAARDKRKVFITDDYTAVGIAGTAAIAVQMVRLFTLELEHYEKIEGVPLTLDGKANRLATMVRDNLSAALQGLAAVPLLVGYDADGPDGGRGRIYSFDVAGDRDEVTSGYYAIGSGSVYAKSSLKKRYRPDFSAADALAAAVESLYDAADDDSATGGPDLTRQLFPIAVTIGAAGAQEVAEAEVIAAAEAIIAARTSEFAQQRAEQE